MAEVTLCAFADEASTDFDGQIKALLRNNIYNIELRGLDGKNISTLTEDEAKLYAEKLDKAGIKVWSLGSPLGKISIESPREEHENLLRKLLKLADIFGTKRIRIFSYFVHREDYAKYRDEVIERMRALVKIADGYMLCHENESEIFGATVKNCEDIYDNVNGLYSVFDSSNFIQWDEDIKEAYDKLVKRAYYIHVKDSRYDTKQIVPVGYGDGMYDKILSGLTKDTTLTLEPHLFKFTGYSDIDKKELKPLFSFKDSNESFDAAVNALKTLLKKCGYIEGVNGKWKK